MAIAAIAGAHGIKTRLYVTRESPLIKPLTASQRPWRYTGVDIFLAGWIKHHCNRPEVCF